jgi:hypothetical protein
MTLIEYKELIIEEIKKQATFSDSYPSKQFVEYAIERLENNGEIIEGEIAFYENFGLKNRKILIDGYSFDDADNSLTIFQCDYDEAEEIQIITKTDVLNTVSKMKNFIDEVINNNLKDKIQFTDSAHFFANQLEIALKNNSLNKIKFIVVTTKKLSERVIKRLEYEKVIGIDTEISIWDLARFHQFDEENLLQEEIEIDFQKYNSKGIVALEASSNGNDYQAYLSVIPGNILAEMYIEYGSKLLEGNVRSFLSTKVKVNKGIRTTILSEPYNFFTYNNGIAVTATEADFLKLNDQLIITKIKNLQIINGGQTTASLASARLKDGKILNDISVQMKLTIVNREKAEELIPKISRYSNSQNKVSEIDFFSSHPFHISMEKISRRVYANPVNDSQISTQWYYERARGSYQQEQMKLTSSQRKNYLIKVPKNQKVTISDLAKYHNTYKCFPHYVSRGSQRNMEFFAQMINKSWEKNSNVFHEGFYKRMISIAIIFKTAENIVMNLDWYKQGYRAHIVTYTLSKIFKIIEEKHVDYSLDFTKIWNKQAISDELKKEITRISKITFEHITSEDRKVEDVKEWAKKEDCWKDYSKIDIDISNSLTKTLILKNVLIKEDDKDEEDEIINGVIANEILVVNKGSKFWKKLYENPLTYGLLNEHERKLLLLAVNMEKTGKTPTKFQAKEILNIEIKLKEEGILADNDGK